MIIGYQRCIDTYYHTRLIHRIACIAIAYHYNTCIMYVLAISNKQSEIKHKRGNTS